MNRIVSIALIAVALSPAIACAEMAVNKKSGVALVPPPANTGAVAPSEQASTAREPKETGGRLRCWQHGRLLYEDTGFVADAERQPNAGTVRRLDGGSVVGFDQKASVCILTKK